MWGPGPGCSQQLHVAGQLPTEWRVGTHSSFGFCLLVFVLKELPHARKEEITIAAACGSVPRFITGSGVTAGDRARVFGPFPRPLSPLPEVPPHPHPHP